MKANSKFELLSTLENFIISIIMYQTYHLEVWFDTFSLQDYKNLKCLIKTDIIFQLDSHIEVYEVTGFMYHTYHLEVWYVRL